MRQDNVIKKNIAYLSVEDINEICDPLFKKFSINYFLYARKYKDNSLLALTSHRDWYCHYLNNHYPLLITSVEGVHTWVTTMLPSAMEEGANSFNLYNGIVLEKNYPEFIEVVEFASSSPYNHPIEFICNHKDFFNKFIFYFKEKANALIQKADNERLYLPASMYSNQKNSSSPYDEFCRAIHIKKFNMNFNSQNIIFSKREFEVLLFLSEGKTMKQIAKLMNLSFRTCEAHLQNAKNKTTHMTTNILINNFRRNLF